MNMIKIIGYHFKEGFKNLYRNRMFTLASIATISACIFLFGVLYSVLVNFQYMIKKAESELCVTVFFDEGLSVSEINKLGDNISKRIEVKEVHYTSSDEAWQNFKAVYFKEYPELALGFKDDNPLADSSSFEVYLNDSSMQSTLVTYIENLNGVRKVNRSEITANSLSSVATLVGYLAVGLVVILLAVSIFLITNTIIIGISVRKDEIFIMKYLGATDGFINAPFFIEGIVIGIVGSVIPLGLLAYVYQNLINYVLEKFAVLNNILVFLPMMDVFTILVPVGVVLGIGIGAIGSSVAVKKHSYV